MSSQYYKNLLRSAKGELSDLRKRKTQLNGIKNGYQCFDNYATDLNNFRNSVIYSSTSGIKVGGGKNNPNSVIGKKDSGTGDSNISSSRTYINAEIQNVQNRIDELESDIASYKRSIEVEEQKEREEAAAI